MEKVYKAALIGKVVRLHSESQPDRYKLYMVIEGKYDDFAGGKVTVSTVAEWLKNDLGVTVYAEI